MKQILNPYDIVRLIDASLLRPSATSAEITKLCEQAKHYSFAAVFVMPAWLPLIAKLLKGSGVIVGASIAFPLGTTSTVVKVAETRDAIASGADQIDMVMNVGAFKSGDYEMTERDIRAVVEAAQGRVVKVIIETCLLTDEEKRKACLVSKRAGAHFVKTSSGFSTGGATIEDIALMRRVVGPEMGVKAAGGIRTYKQAMRMIEAGANGIGTSTPVRIAEGARRAQAQQRT